MDTEYMTDHKTHLGYNVRRLRQILGVKQELIAERLNISPSVLSRHEQKDIIEDDLLDKIAEAMGITAETIRNYNEEATMNFISNTFNLSDTSIGANNIDGCTFNPIEKIVELYNEKEKLYERMLKAEQEKNAMLERMLENKE